MIIILQASAPQSRSVWCASGRTKNERKRKSPGLAAAPPASPAVPQPQAFLLFWYPLRRRGPTRRSRPFLPLSFFFHSPKSKKKDTRQVPAREGVPERREARPRELAGGAVLGFLPSSSPACAGHRQRGGCCTAFAAADLLIFYFSAAPVALVVALVAPVLSALGLRPAEKRATKADAATRKKRIGQTIFRGQKKTEI